jgi:hypothetical protein
MDFPRSSLSPRHLCCATAPSDVGRRQVVALDDGAYRRTDVISDLAKQGIRLSSCVDLLLHRFTASASLLGQPAIEVGYATPAAAHCVRQRCTYQGVGKTEQLLGARHLKSLDKGNAHGEREAWVAMPEGWITAGKFVVVMAQA